MAIYAEGSDGEVTLEGDRLERARALHASLGTALGGLATLIAEAVGDEPPVDQGGGIVGKADVVLGGSADAVPVLVVLGPDYCYVYDNTTGQCRPCTGDELSSHA
jgi:hypothetical protein